VLRFVEGGVAGSVNIITRKPLDFFQRIYPRGVGRRSVRGSALEDRRAIQCSGQLKNDANNSESWCRLVLRDAHLRRDGVEVLGYETIAPGSAVATAHPDLANVQYPTDIGAAFFEQKR